MTLLQVVRRLASFRGDASFATWLFRVTANEALMLMRSQRRQRARLVEGSTSRISGGIARLARRATTGNEARARTEWKIVLRKALAEFPEDYRHIVVAHYQEDQGLQEIADQLRVTESAVRSRLHRARSRLRAILENTEPPLRRLPTAKRPSRSTPRREGGNCADHGDLPLTLRFAFAGARRRECSCGNDACAPGDRF